MSRGKSTKAVGEVCPSVGQAGWSKELSNRAYANVQGTTEFTTSQEHRLRRGSSSHPLIPLD